MSDHLPRLIETLTQIVGANHVLTDPTLTSSYETDWTGRFGGRAALVVRPENTAQVSGVLRACSAAAFKVVVQGGNTGLVGGGVPTGTESNEVLLSLTRLDTLEPIDTAAAQVTAGAGVRLAALQTYARAADLDFGVDLAARDSATVGGLIATNAGGIRVLRYGSMRAQLLGLEAVLADGSVVSRLGGLPKDNTGYDLTSLFTGSEGTLAVITRARLRLVARERARAVALVAVQDTTAAIDLLSVLRAELGGVMSAAELMLDEGVELARAAAGLPRPFAAPAGAYLLVECSGRDDPSDLLMGVLAEASQVIDANVATASDPGGQRALWQYREGHTEAVNAAGIPVKLDVAVPIGELAGLIEVLPALVAAAAPKAQLFIWGHLNEGNLHVNIVNALEPVGANGAPLVEEAVLRAVADRAGTISSEHGIGRAKAEWLGLSRTPAEIAVMSAVKEALDPTGMLSPGVIFPAEFPVEPAPVASKPGGPALVWQRPMLGLVTSQGSWIPEIELVNESEHPVELSGGPMATGQLRRSDGTPVATKARWAMPAVAIIHKLAPGQAVPIRIAVQLLDEEIAALEPGAYQLTGVRWGGLTAPDKDVRVDAV